MLTNIGIEYELTHGGTRVMDMNSILFDERTLFLTTEINALVMDHMIKKLLLLDSLDHETPIDLFISSPGGSVYAGLAIIDVMNAIQSPIHTYSMGLTASMASIIFACGTKRYMLPSSKIMLHQPLGGFSGQASDIAITASEIMKLKHFLNTLLAEKTRNSVEEIEKITDRDAYFDARSAIDLGIADEITTHINYKG